LHIGPAVGIGFGEEPGNGKDSAQWFKPLTCRRSRHHWHERKFVEWLAKLPERPRTIFKTCAYGFVAGLVAVAFQLAINGCYRAGMVRLSQCSHTTFLWSSLGLILGTSLVSAILPPARLWTQESARVHRLPPFPHC
jgi:hypothetical protein